MSKRRKQNSRRPKGEWSRRVNGASAVRNSDQPPSGHGVVLSDGSSLDLRSCTFYEPEAAVTTFELSLSVDGIGNSVNKHSSDLVKGCERRFAIEHCGTIRLCTPGYYREEGQSLIWDMQEGFLPTTTGIQGRCEFHCSCDAHISEPTTEKRWDDPADLQEQRMIDLNTTLLHPMGQARGRITSTKLKVTESKRPSLTYGDNCLIWCCSLKPRSLAEDLLWRESLESSYDHVSEIRNPHLFAQSLGAMTFQQVGAQGNLVSFRNPQTRDTADFPTLPVVYGPVTYVDDRQTFIEESTSDLEFIIRSVFTKTVEHKDQREFRFAILTDQPLEANTLDIEVSPEMRTLLGRQHGLSQVARNADLVQFNGCGPSPRFQRCISVCRSPHPSAGVLTMGKFETHIRSSFRLSAVYHQNTKKSRRTTHTLEGADFEQIEQAIANLPSSPNDARIGKFTFDAGPGCKIDLYSLEGLDGTYRLVKRSKQVVVSPNLLAPTAPNGNRRVYVDCSEFDGTSILHDNSTGVTVASKPISPGTTATYNLSETETGQTITVVATSEDATATSTFEIVLDKNLGISLDKREEADRTARN